MGEFEIDMDEFAERMRSAPRGEVGGETETITPKQRKARRDKQEKDAEKEFKKSLRLAKRRNLIWENTMRIERIYQTNLNRLAVRGLQRSIARGANYNLIAPPQPTPPKGGRGGRGFMGAVGMGAGAAATFLLVAAINKMVNESKIVSVTLKAFNQAMGLLLDVILIPFLPMITYGIIQLFKAIMEFKTIWDDPKKRSILLTFGVGPLIATELISGWINGLLDFLFNPNSDKLEQMISFGLGIGRFILPVDLSWLGDLLSPLLKYVLGIDVSQTLNDIIFNIIPKLIIDSIMGNPWIKAIIEFIFSPEHPINIPPITIDIIPNFTGFNLPDFGKQNINVGGNNLPPPYISNPPDVGFDLGKWMDNLKKGVFGWT